MASTGSFYKESLILGNKHIINKKNGRKNTSEPPRPKGGEVHCPVKLIINNRLANFLENLYMCNV